MHALPAPACVLSGLLRLSKEMHIRLIGNSKLLVDVNVSADDCLTDCVGPAMKGDLFRVCPAFNYNFPETPSAGYALIENG